MVKTQPSGTIIPSDFGAYLKENYILTQNTERQAHALTWLPYTLFHIMPSFKAASQWNSTGMMRKVIYSYVKSDDDNVGLILDHGQQSKKQIRQMLEVDDDCDEWLGPVIATQPPPDPYPAFVNPVFKRDECFTYMIKNYVDDNTSVCYIYGISTHDENLEGTTVTDLSVLPYTLTTRNDTTLYSPDMPVSSYLMHDIVEKNMNRLLATARSQACVPYFGSHTTESVMMFKDLPPDGNLVSDIPDR